MPDTIDQTPVNNDPVLTTEVSEPSPVAEQAATIAQERGMRQRIAVATAAGPSVRQATQAETIDLGMLHRHLGNPFSTRWIPFEQLREMTTDLMLAFGWYMTVMPLIRSEWMIDSPDAQLAAAVDEALRPIITQTTVGFSNALWFGHQPGVKRFRLGRLGGTYRDPQGQDPDKDIPVWASTADALLWKVPSFLNPSHCLPSWDDDGQLAGYQFSNLPIPHFDLINASNAYGYQVINGKYIDNDRAIWIVNEQELNFGSIYGGARAKRAYPYWWSYWFRWRMADRSFENLADPPKLVYYPVDFDTFIDPEDPNADNPQLHQARQTAIEVGSQMRSGSTVALPGTFHEGADGKTTNQRKWEVSYAEARNNFSELDATFTHLDTLKLRSWFLPEQAFIEGRGAVGGSRVATQLGQVYEESQQYLVDDYDRRITEHFIPQFIAANFPEKAGTPCAKKTRSIGVLDEQIRQQVLTLIGQVRGEVLPVDVRELLRQMNIPLLNEGQMRKEMSEIAKLAAISGPPETPPGQRGTQGYNAGVMKTEVGSFSYYAPPQRIVLAESDGFMNTLPDTPHFRDVAVRSSLIRMRRLFLDRYQSQLDGFADFLAAQPTLHLAQNGNGSAKKQGLSKKQAAASAAAIIAAWAAKHAPGIPGHPLEAIGAPGGIPGKLAVLVNKIALAGGKNALKGARLSTDEFGEDAISPWATDRVKFALDSVDGTIRTEAEQWLADQLQQSVDPTTVADAAREHFSDFPVTHADRVVRTETRDAFNHGTLKALSLAGVSQVQAHDASDGEDEKTDAECLERNGQVYAVEEAMKLDEHPNGTLYFTPLSTERLRVERVDVLPDHLAADDRKVAYDERAEILYLAEEFDEQRERDFLLMLGSQLSLV